MTPTEITAAHAAGADIVKLFPAGALGVEYFKAIKAPLRHIPVAAVGGVTPENLLLFKKAGACAYGISTGIFNAAAIKVKITNMCAFWRANTFDLRAAGLTAALSAA